MDVSAYLTTQAHSSERKDTTVNGPAAGKSRTLNFIDMILARLAETEETKASDQQALDSKNALFDSEMDMADILAVDEDVREEIKNWMFGADSKLQQTLSLNQKALENALKPVTSGIITPSNVEAGSPRMLQALLIDENAHVTAEGKAMLQRLQQILAKIEQLKSDPQTGGLIISNMTPEEITALKNKVEILLNDNADETLSLDDKNSTVDGIYMGLVALLAPAPEAGNAASIQAAINKQKADIESHLNSLARASKGEGPKSPWTDGPIEDAGDSASNGNQFADTLKDFSGKKSVKADATPTPGVKPDLSALQNWHTAMEGTIFAPANWTAASLDDYTTAPGQALTVTSLTAMTNVVTQAHAASHPHPAMQTIAATISKNAATGEAKNITLQLDPPELGRVEIRMSFGKDKAVKAVLVAEKPETLSMMQRDASVLERALTDSGLNANGSLSFELAHEGYQFNHQGRDDGRGGYASKDDGVQEIIESTMTWHVDPDTGHMRYSIMA